METNPKKVAAMFLKQDQMPKIHTTQEQYSRKPLNRNYIFVILTKKQRDIIALTEISKQAEIIIKNDIKNASKDVIKVKFSRKKKI